MLFLSMARCFVNNAGSMLKAVARICSSGKFLRTLKTRQEGRRWFLSQAYRCQDAWMKRLQNPILQQIKLDDFYYEVDSKHQHKQMVSAIDVDLFVNAARDAEHLDEAEDLVHKLRLSANAADILPSTHHAFIRLLLDVGHVEELLRILNDRINYGIFPDYYDACLLMDTFLKQHNYTAAAQIAALQMLQEDWDDVLTTHLALYSCHKHLQQPGQWLPEEVPEPPDDGVVELVRVAFIINPYFDDHFDLRDPKLLVGKTLAAAGACVPGAMGRTNQLLGWVMYEKWGRALAVLERLVAGTEDPVFYKEGLEKCKVLLEEAVQKEGADVEALEQLSRRVSEVVASGRVTDQDLLSAMEGAVRRLATELEPEKVSHQLETYETWERLREERLHEELAAVRREQRREEIAHTLEDMERRERTIFFFDNEEQWELKLETKEQEEAAAAAAMTTSASKAKKQKEEDDNYIPPEVGRSRA